MDKSEVKLMASQPEGPPLESHTPPEKEFAAEHAETAAPQLEGDLLHQEQHEDLEPVLHWRTFMVIFACGMSYLALVWTLVVIGLQGQSIAATVGGASDLPWIQNSGTLVSVVIAPPLSRISDAVGRKWIVVICTLGGVLGNCLIGASTSMNMAIAGGTLCGLLVGMQGPYSAIVSEVTPRRYRALAQGLLNIGPSTGGILAATASQKIGSFARFGSVAGWRATFYLNAGMVALAALLLVVFYNPPPTPNPENRTYTERWMDFDKVGTFLLTAAITPLTIGLTWGGGAYPWRSAHAIAPTVVGGLLLFLFAAHQIWFKKDGLFHHKQFGHRNFALAITANFVEGIFYYVLNQFIGQQAATVYDSRPMQFGLFFAIFFAPQIFVYPICGWYTKRYRDCKGPLVAGYVLFVGVMIGFTQTGPGDASKAGFMAGLVLCGVAFVPAEVLLQTVAQLAVPPELIGTTASLGAAIRSLGGVVGVAIATSIVNSKLAENFPKYIVPAAVAAGLPPTSLAAFIPALASGNSAALEAVPGVTPGIIAASITPLKEAFAQSFKYIWIMEVPFMVLALICVLFLRSTKEQMNWIVNRPVEAITYKKH